MIPANWRPYLHPTDSPTATRLGLCNSLSPSGRQVARQRHKSNCHFPSSCLRNHWPTDPTQKYRLLHSPSLVAIGLLVGYETWPPIGWHHAFVIGWSKDRLGLPSAHCIYGLTWPVGIPTVLQTPVTVPSHYLNDRQLPVVGAVEGDCEKETKTRYTVSPEKNTSTFTLLLNISLKLKYNNRAVYPRNNEFEEINFDCYGYCDFVLPIIDQFCATPFTNRANLTQHQN